jgi:hypothetical protein
MNDITKFSPKRYLTNLRKKPSKQALAYCERALFRVGYLPKSREEILGRLETEAEAWALGQKVSDYDCIRRGGLVNWRTRQ